jgi:hypothetical protein
MRYFAWAVAVLGLLAVNPAQADAQVTNPVRLKQNSPNPFNPETTIPFVLSEELWEVDRPVVSLRIYNVLAQIVAIPVLQGTGEKFENIALDWNGTGEYEAFWDGKVLDTGREAPSGVYVYQIIVNGRAAGSKKMTVIK